jgi:hypothetical protein
MPLVAPTLSLSQVISEIIDELISRAIAPVSIPNMRPLADMFNHHSSKAACKLSLTSTGFKVRNFEWITPILIRSHLIGSLCGQPLLDLPILRNLCST